MDAGMRTRVPLSFQGARIVAISPPVFSGELLEASYPRHFVFGSSDAPQIRILETGDTTARIIRWESASIPVTPDRVEIYTRTLVAGGGVEELVRGRLGGAGTAATFPHYSGLIVEPGHVWVRAYRLPDEEGPASWTRLTFEGEPVARIELPEDLTLLQAGPDFALVRRSDDLGVQHVVLLGIGPG
jgi:hypothetical protein